ncbi:TniB family NTP-binding protein [Chitinibacter sp. S2-10]|uniref:TniB family NTP-binding protein n=1 Tax=Chitinibacter sp. S2-10 TaxID=3373597 RepID=UPI003977D078
MTKPDYSHLGKKAKELITGSAQERIIAVQSGSWISYPRAVEILDKLERLLNYPEVTRMPNMLIVGPSNNGKSSILEQFQHRHLPDLNPDGDAAVAPVVTVESPSHPDVSDFYGRILDKLFIAYPPRATPAERCRQVKHIFETLQVKVLLIDEIHHLIAGSLSKQRDFRNAIKSLGNECKISIVAAGIEESYNAFNTDPQLSNRFVPETLPRWRLDTTFGSILMTLEQRMPLKLASNLYDTAMAQKILWLSEGTLGDTCDLLKLAAEHAITNGDERITSKLLDSLPWVPPSMRKANPASM